MTTPVKSIVVVGGGTAGWLAACLLAANHRQLPDEAEAGSPGLSITLIESPDIPTIGVGEGTWPTMRNTLKKIGISETDFIRHCNASFKQGSKFSRWTTGASDDFYYHPFNGPSGHHNLVLAPYWYKELQKQGVKFADAVDYQHSICEANLAPKTLATAEYSVIANYGYHLDAGKFAELLRDHAIKSLGVTHVLDNVTEVLQDDEGYVTAVERQSGEALTGDLFVDCTGFRCLLLGETLKVPFIEKRDILFADTALAMQIPYEDERQEVASYTLSTGQSAGWVWDIGLSNRRGVGHVYSSAHISDEKAEAELRAYIGKASDGLDARRIAFKSGHRERFWEKNVVAIGLSAGFLEPLEASALLLAEISCNFVSNQLPRCREAMPHVANRFNKLFLYRWDQIIDFLKLHYALTKRTDSDFWLDNTRPESIPSELQERLQYWRYQSPSEYDFQSGYELFDWSSYHYVLYGMDFGFDDTVVNALTPDEKAARNLFLANDRQKQQMMKNLPSNRELLTRLQKYAFQPV